MSNFKLKRQRMESYFIDAACDIIREHGVTAATIRTVADKAGYNSATLYSYFKSFSHLLAHVSFQFEQEMLTAIEKKLAGLKESDFIKIWTLVYIEMADFLLDNPNIFECNFVTIYVGLTRDEVVLLRDNNSKYAQFVAKNLKEIAVQQTMDIDELNRISHYCLSLIIGAVLLSLKQRSAENKTILLTELKLQIEFLIKFHLRSENIDEQR